MDHSKFMESKGQRPEKILQDKKKYFQINQNLVRVKSTMGATERMEESNVVNCGWRTQIKPILNLIGWLLCPRGIQWQWT